jgi:UDP-glucose 4-epimerase
MKTKVLVTGSAGFIGYHLSKKLCELESFEVIGIDNFIRNSPDVLYSELTKNKLFTHLNLDLLDADSFKSLPKFDFVFHLAALNGTNNFYERPLDVIKAGIIPTLNLLDFLELNPPKKLIYAGTSESYAGAVDIFDYKVPTPEEVPLVIGDVKNPRWSYAASKSLGEVAVVSSAMHNKFHYNVVRFHNVYGPRMGNSHVIPQIAVRAQARDFRIFGGKNQRSFIYIDDAVSALLMILLNDVLLDEIVNIGTEEIISIGELTQIIYQTIGLTGESIDLGPPDGSVMSRCPDVSKLKSIGFIPKVQLQKGVELTVEYYRGLN